MTTIKTFCVTVALTIMSTTCAIAEMPVVKASVLKFGTVNWELTTIQSKGFDTENGFTLEVQGVAGGSAAKVAFQAGETDVIVTDWLWVARQRAAGKDYVFLPYSKAVGSVMVSANSPAKTIADLEGSKIGIAGGSLDKSWLILRAYAEQKHGMDLKATTEQVFGAPPLIMKSALQGETDGAINFWHYLAKMEASGMRPLISVSDAATELGLNPEIPLLGYVFHGDYLREFPERVAGLAAASRATKDLLGNEDAAWDDLRAKMKPANDAEFVALIDGFRKGIPTTYDVDQDGANGMLQLMSDLGGTELVGDVSSVPEGLFINPLQ